MAKGNTIVLSVPPKGVMEGGIINDTSKPGTLMQIDTSVQVDKHGRKTWIAAAPGADGLLKGAYPVLMEDKKQGKAVTDAYVAGTECQLYFPLPGEDFNALCGEVAGTGNTYAIGDALELDAETGILVPYSATPQNVFAQCMEVVTQVTGSHLTWVKKV